jgi:hypothetical protein
MQAPHWCVARLIDGYLVTQMLDVTAAPAGLSALEAVPVWPVTCGVRHADEVWYGALLT